MRPLFLAGLAGAAAAATLVAACSSHVSGNWGYYDDDSVVGGTSGASGNNGTGADLSRTVATPRVSTDGGDARADVVTDSGSD